MKKILLIFLIIDFNNIALSSIKKNIISNLINTDNLSFNFEQKIFFGYSMVHFPVSILPLIFCSKLKLKLLVFIKLLIIFSLIELNAILLKLMNKNINKIFFIKEHLFYPHDLLY